MIWKDKWDDMEMRCDGTKEITLWVCDWGKGTDIEMFPHLNTVSWKCNYPVNYYVRLLVSRPICPILLKRQRSYTSIAYIEALFSWNHKSSLPRKQQTIFTKEKGKLCPNVIVQFYDDDKSFPPWFLVSTKVHPAKAKA